MNDVNIVTIDLFSDEEKQVLNSLAEGTGFLADHGEICKAALSLRSLADEDDEMYASLLDGLCAKLNSISADEWDGLKPFLPFPVNIAATHDYVDGNIPDEDE
jgi:hypothetical protein